MPVDITTEAWHKYATYSAMKTFSRVWQLLTGDWKYSDGLIYSLLLSTLLPTFFFQRLEIWGIRRQEKIVI